MPDDPDNEEEVTTRRPAAGLILPTSRGRSVLSGLLRPGYMIRMLLRRYRELLTYFLWICDHDVSIHRAETHCIYYHHR